MVFVAVWLWTTFHTLPNLHPEISISVLAITSFWLPSNLQAVTSWLKTHDTDFLYAGIQILMTQLDKCFHVHGDYMQA
jgi:hypothetical protein